MMNRLCNFSFPLRKNFFLLFLLSFTFISFLSAQSSVVQCFVIINPGGPADQEEAQASMDEFAAALSNISGEKVQAAYFSDEKKALEYLKNNKAVAGIVSPAFYLRHKKSFSFQIELQVKKDKILKQKYYLLVHKDSTCKKLEELKGKNIFSNHFAEADWVSLLLSQKKDFLSKNYRLLFYKNHLRVVRSMVQKKKIPCPLTGDPCNIDGILLDTFQWSVIQQEPKLWDKYGKHLRVLVMSEEFPTMPVVSFSGKPEAILKALSKFSQDKRGKKILELFGMDEFVLPEEKSFQKIEEWWNK